MLVTYLFREPIYWAVPLLIQIISYIRILKKMGRKSVMGILPVLGEWEMSHDLFRRMRSFWRPATISAALYATASYLQGSGEYSLILEMTVLVVYGLFLARLYIRLSKQFGKGFFFTAGLVLIPLVFLPALAFGKSAYLGKPEFRPEPERSKASQAFRKARFVIVSVIEFVVLVVGCFGFATLIRPARPIAQYMLNDDLHKMESVTASDEIIGRADTLGAGFESTVNKQRSRDYFFPDHSNDKKVVVMEYIVGSNLEDSRGSASVNIAQMKNATKAGDGVDFVIEAGGSKRWFTSGIEDSTVGRYIISGGELQTAEMLDEETCMTEPEELTSFIKWTKDNYPADRYMLVLWDHGGGFAYGFGQDQINSRKGSSDSVTASEVIHAIRDAGVKFDLLGFDACLMQNLEFANAFEPYADYYLASEETEPAYGWFYTAAFTKLAEDPTISTEEFGHMMVSSYDQLYRTMNDGEPKPENTLSLVDLTLVKPVYKRLAAAYEKASSEMKDKPVVFADLSASRSKAYQFYDQEQVDLVSFLSGLKKADYKQQIASDEDFDELIDSVKACVVYRNKDAADGINGIAIDFPYSDVSSYKYEYEQLKAVKYKKEEKFFNNFCSIIASQKQRQSDDEDEGFFSILADDYTQEKWYVDGFEDYDTSDLFIDIPVKAVEGGYLPELPEKTWDTILDTSTSAYIVSDDGLMYIGREHFDAGRTEGHPVIAMNDSWAHVGGNLVCYETADPFESDEGIVYKGTIKARLNNTDDITIHVEWDPVKSDSEEAAEGRITGYSIDDEDSGLFFMKKGLEQFAAGDSIEFLFDFYDEQGQLKKTKAYGSPVLVVDGERLSVKEEPFEAGTEIECYGILTDVYQRELMTEAIDFKSGEL